MAIAMKVTFVKSVGCKEEVETGVFADIIKSAHKIIDWVETKSVFVFDTTDGTNIFYLKRNDDGTIYEEVRKVAIRK